MPKKEVDLELAAGCQYEIEILRENDVVSLRLNEEEIISYCDLLPLTGTECSRLRFFLSEGKVSMAGLVIEIESAPLRGSPLIVADRLFMEGLYQLPVVFLE